jgi:hypothetical protein
MITVITPPTSNDLTTVAAAQRELQLPVSESTPVIEALIRQASIMCARYCGRAEGFGRATVRQTERLTRGAACIILERDIAPAVAAVTEAGVTLAATDYELDGSLLYRLSGDHRASWSPATVVVTYAAGLTLPGSVDGDLERACLATMQALYSARGRDPMLRSESADGVGSMSYLDPRAGAEAVPPIAAGLLAPWLRLTL